MLKRRKSPYGVVANMLDCNIIGNEFKLQSCYYVHFKLLYPVEKYEALYTISVMG